MSFWSTRRTEYLKALQNPAAQMAPMAEPTATVIPEKGVKICPNCGRKLGRGAHFHIRNCKA